LREEEDDAEDVEEESPGVISAFGLPSLEPETARRILGGAPSLLLDELLEELFAELFDELPDELLELSSELELARRSLGRSGSLSLDELDEELPDELLELLSELDDAARRNVGLFGFEVTVELLLELFEEDDDEDALSDDFGSGLMSSVCSDASECSSAVPSLTIEMVVAL
jgi:hypothetical protein